MSNQSTSSQPWWKVVAEYLPTILLIGPLLIFLFSIVGQAYIEGYASALGVSAMPNIFASSMADYIAFFGFMVASPVFGLLLITVSATFTGIAVLLLGLAAAEPRFSDWWSQKNSPKDSSKSPMRLSEVRVSQADMMVVWSVRLMAVTVGFVILMNFLGWVTNSATASGREAGQRLISGAAVPVDIISSIPLTSLESTAISGDGSGYITRVYFIVQHGDTYYVFTKLDPSTCRPEMVTALPLEKFEYAHFYPRVRLDESCIP